MLVYVSEQKGLSGLSFDCHIISSIKCILLLNPRISVAVLLHKQNIVHVPFFKPMQTKTFTAADPGFLERGFIHFVLRIKGLL